MNHSFQPLLSLAALALITTATQAGTIISEKFTGSDSTDLVGTATPDGNTWTGGAGEIPTPEKAEDGTETTAAPKFSIKQDGSVGGIAFTAYHKFTLKPGQTYTLFDGSGNSLHGPNSIGTPDISQVFIGNSGTGGDFKSLTLSDDAAKAESEPTTE